MRMGGRGLVRGWEAGQPGLGVRGHAEREDSRGRPPEDRQDHRQTGGEGGSGERSALAPTL